MSTVYLWVLLKLFIGFILIISYLNFTGRNQIAMMTSVDLIGNFILGGVVGGILYNDKLPIWHYIILLVLCVLMMALFNYIARKIPGIRKRTIGEPITLIRDGQFLVDNYEDNASRIDIKDVATALRMQNIFSFDNIAFAQVETTGHVSVIMKDGEQKPARFVIHRGEVLHHELEALGRDEAWLDRQLAHIGERDHKKILLAEWVQDHMLVISKDGAIRTGVI